MASRNTETFGSPSLCNRKGYRGPGVTGKMQGGPRWTQTVDVDAIVDELCSFKESQDANTTMVRGLALKAAAFINIYDAGVPPS